MAFVCDAELITPYLHMIQQQLLGQLVAGLRLLDLFVDERVHNADAAVHGERGRHLLVALVKVEAVNLYGGGEGKKWT